MNRLTAPKKEKVKQFQRLSETTCVSIRCLIVPAFHGNRAAEVSSLTGQHTLSPVILQREGGSRHHEDGRLRR